MKPKSYWEKEAAESDPFELPKRVSKGLADCSKRGTEDGAAHAIRYIWIYVTDEGLKSGRSREPSERRLGLDDWLNIIDESAALGAEWMVIYVGASLSQSPMIWEMCRWAQETHGLRVGLHLSSNSLSEDDIEHLTQLSRSQTFLVADAADIPSLSFLAAHGIQLCEANIRPEDRATPCNKPEAIGCVGPDGKMFSCGLVLGQDRYRLGDARAEAIGGVMSDASLPHVIESDETFAPDGCDACPPLMAERMRARIED